MSLQRTLMMMGAVMDDIQHDPHINHHSMVDLCKKVIHTMKHEASCVHSEAELNFLFYYLVDVYQHKYKWSFVEKEQSSCLSRVAACLSRVAACLSRVAAAAGGRKK